MGRKVQRNKVWGFICIEAIVEIIKSDYIAMRKTIKMGMSLIGFWKTIAFKHGKAYLRQGVERANSFFIFLKRKLFKESEATNQVCSEIQQGYNEQFQKQEAKKERLKRKEKEKKYIVQKHCILPCQNCRQIAEKEN